MLAELQKPVPSVLPIFSFTVAGTTYRYSGLGAGVAGEGVYEGKLSWGGAEVPIGFGLQDTALDFPSLQVMIDDREAPHALTRLIEGANRNFVRGAAASIILASPNVAAASWFTGLAGQIDTFSQPAPWMWSLTIGSRAQPLKRESVPKAKITAADWPSSPVASRDLYAPIIYGRITSASATNNGAVPAIYVDRSGFVYLLAAGWLKSVDTVYKDGAPLAASAYAITHPIVNGRRYTCVDFSTDQGTSAITADVQGYETVGDGSGTLITDPATIAKHVLVNWVYGNYKTGAWLLDSSAPVDTTSFGTTFFSDRGYSHSVYIDKLRRGKDVLNDLTKSMGARACWTSDGKVALKVLDWTSFAYVADPQILRRADIAGWDLKYPIGDLIDALEGKFARSPSGNQYNQTLTVKDLNTAEDAPDAIELPYSGSFFL